MDKFVFDRIYIIYWNKEYVYILLVCIVFFIWAYFIKTYKVYVRIEYLAYISVMIVI